VRPYFRPSITVFLNDVANEKTTSSYTTDPATGDDISHVTAADTVTRGSELAISGKVGESWNYSASYTYWISDNATKNLSNSRQLVSARLGYRYKFIFANISTSYAGPKYYSNSPAGLAILPMADYDRVDANGGFDFKLMNRATKLSFYGRNLGNNHYFTRYVTGAYKDVGLQYGMDLSISFF
jgi:outer membrane receptor for ferric coprogen and ferric-rhodotorulic acid